MPIQGASEKWAGRFYDKGAAVFNAEHPDFGSSAQAAGVRIKAAIDALPAEGGVVDARGLRGAQTIAVDMFADLATRPVTLLLGQATITISAQQRPSSSTRIILDGTTLLASTDQLQMWRPRSTSTTASVTNGSASITVASASEIDIDDLVGIFGHVPRGGRDNGTLTGAHTSGQVTIEVDATLYAALPASGYIKINNEIIRYSAKAGANVLTVQTRGYGGSTAAAHNNGDAVDRVVYEKYIVRSVSGTTVGLDRLVTCPTATAIDLTVGSTDIVFDGAGVIDGAKTSDTDPGGTDAFGVLTQLARFLRIGRHIRFRRWDHGGVMLTASQDCVVDGDYHDTGRATSSLGAAVWLFQNCTDCTVYGDYDRGYECIKVDDRTTAPGLWDNSCDDNVVEPRSVRGGFIRAVSIVGDRNYARVPHARACVSSVIHFESLQWVTNPTLARNYAEVGAHDDTSPAINVATECANGNNTFIAKARTSRFTNTQPGNSYEGPRAYTNQTGTAFTPNCAHGDYFRYTLSGAATIGVPTSGYYGAELDIDIVNPTGGALNTVFNAVYKTTFAGTLAVAAGKRRTVRFRLDGTAWTQIGDASADI